MLLLFPNRSYIFHKHHSRCSAFIRGGHQTAVSQRSVACTFTQRSLQAHLHSAVAVKGLSNKGNGHKDYPNTQAYLEGTFQFGVMHLQAHLDSFPCCYTDFSLADFSLKGDHAVKMFVLISYTNACYNVKEQFQLASPNISKHIL